MHGGSGWVADYTCAEGIDASYTPAFPCSRLSFVPFLPHAMAHHGGVMCVPLSESLRSDGGYKLCNHHAAVGEPTCPTAGISTIKPDAGGARLTWGLCSRDTNGA